MAAEKREYPRFLPQGLHTTISISADNQEDLFYDDGEILDLSYNGIKIKLHKPIKLDYLEKTINLMIITPQSAIPITVLGLIRHYGNSNEYGLQFCESQNERIIDKLMFECIKYSDHPIANNNRLVFSG